MKIGVIGGNGVAATNRLCAMIENKVTLAGAFRDAHHPEMIIWQATSVPSRSMFLEGRGPDWRPDYIRIAKELKRLGCDYGCMCCNTAHYAVNEIEEESHLKFLNLLEEVAQAVLASGCKRVEMFCSDGARKFDIYGAVFRRICPGVEMVYPCEERQRLVTKIICSVKTSARFAGDPASELKNLILSSSHPVVLGCTDLRVAFRLDQQKIDGIVVDSLECLADTIVKVAGNKTV